MRRFRKRADKVPGVAPGAWRLFCRAFLAFADVEALQPLLHGLRLRAGSIAAPLYAPPSQPQSERYVA